ncbi:tyrosine-protein kinase family protein [Nodularia sp. UHCC 0506]|uniref:tyrosine-protein kinase family protein n=1 Tax=Nodularia sp. UHCC 0506 TaxID=3110243 RepID=UPI002B20E5F2|nr:AAA family ATPase [Nodularia sp. UHCC 0506]MEA5517137.1 AAA family ATPase [Nodularia sp. UHCC 0506]
MAISFSETFTKIRECFQEPEISSLWTENLQSITIIRDVYGAIRLYLEHDNNFIPQKADITTLETSLSQKLGSYYGKDIWLPQGEQDGYKPLIKVIIDQRVPAEWDDDTVAPRWYILERHIAKKAWTDKDAGSPPWEQKFVDQGHKPAILTFFSFKGGVGRTTGLVASAITLASRGHRVAIVDLDLEAPGLSTIFFPDDVENPGVIDYLLEKKIQQNNWPLKTHILSINEQTLLGDRGETLRLISAGTVDNNYLEKLARLDFQNVVDHELPDTLRNLLRELESASKPLDFIFLDARAGFHDIGGLAIADLSHGAVIFGTQSRQSWAGLTNVIRRLARPLAQEQLPVILVHAMAPTLREAGRVEELKAFADKAYQTFQTNYYDDNEIVPNIHDSDAPFTPVVLPLQDDLRGDIALFLRDESPEEASRLSELVKVITSDPYQGLAMKICRLFGREFHKKMG